MLGFFLHTTLFEYILVILIFINLIVYLVSNNKKIKINYFITKVMKIIKLKKK